MRREEAELTVCLKRRELLWTLAAAGSGGILRLSGRVGAQEKLPLTPSCTDEDEPTPSQTEGPYFTPNSPERWQFLEPGMKGTPILLTGIVLTQRCVPIADAMVELWQANEVGEYDNEGFRLRGHQFTDNSGLYRFSTIVPGLYPGRTRHFHLKFQAPNQSVLTTQFYFPAEPDNERDRLFNPELLLKINRAPELTGRFDVVLG
jgi:protocatechuate 3,4-dioxygenase beta subunit